MATGSTLVTAYPREQVSLTHLGKPPFVTTAVPSSLPLLPRDLAPSFPASCLEAVLCRSLPEIFMPSALGLDSRRVRGKETCSDLPELTTNTLSHSSTSPGPSPGSGKTCPGSPRLEWLQPSSAWRNISHVFASFGTWPLALCLSVLASHGDTGHWM